MSARSCLVLCLLALGCAESARAPDADGGTARDAAAALVARSQLAVIDAGTNMWVVRPASGSASSEARDAGHDSGLIPVPRIGHDAGQTQRVPSAPHTQPPMAADEDDAGTEPVTSCETSNCLCGRLCARGLALGCIAEDPLDTCVELCDVASSDCYEPLLRVLRCKAELPESAYSCDPDLFVFVVDGCAVEETALQTCRRF